MKRIFASLCCLAFLCSVCAQAPLIVSATPTAAGAEQWGKFEIKVNVVAQWKNPYDYDDIKVSCRFTSPDGAQKNVEGFYMEPYKINAAGGLTADGAGSFYVRFSPDKPGAWTYALSCANASGANSFPQQSFQVAPPQSALNKGFIREGTADYLRFDAGEAFVPVGENICWQQSNVYGDYTQWLGKLRAAGGNFFRLWQCHWGLGLEWKAGVAGYNGIGQYKQNNAAYLDWLFDYCSENGIYVMNCLQHHGQVSTQVNPNWSDNPYNAANGGPCQQTWDFFTHASAKKWTLNRYRYCLARWGYARSMMAWELFNEVDWTDQFAQRKTAVSDWHLEMAAFFKKNDPYGRLVTTSYAHENASTVWGNPDIDFTQTHFYFDTPNLERILKLGNLNYLSQYDKPTLNGEFGLGLDGGALSTLDPEGIHIHNGIWGGLFSGGLGAGMSWWWDTYIDPLQLYRHFSGPAAVAAQVSLGARDYAPIAPAVSGGAAALQMTPALDWGALADTLFNVAANGQITPVGAALSAYLYGAQWNTQYRRPPIFKVTYPQNGQFQVKTAANTGEKPNITIWIDGQKVFEQAAAPNQTYSVALGAGVHTIRVDNRGTDWIQIAAYVFSGIGAGAEAYVLQTKDRKQAAGWLLNSAYNHDYIAKNGLPPAANNIMVEIPNWENGAYEAQYFQCTDGALLSSVQVNVADGTLRLAPPAFLWDIAFAVRARTSGAKYKEEGLSFEIYPNPANGQEISLSLPPGFEGAYLRADLLDVGGRVIGNIYAGHFEGGARQFRLPPLQAAGLYWVKITTERKTGVKALIRNGY